MTATKGISSSVLRFFAALALAGAVLPASAEEAQPPDLRGVRLMPGAPRWASRASSPVWLRYTNKWQEMKTAVAAGRLAAPAPEAPVAAAVVFGQKVFNNDTWPLPQNETTIAIDPKNANRIVGGYNDYRGLVNGNNMTGWSISTNGGATVAKDGQLPAVDVLGTTVPSQGDPAVAVDKNGNFFLGSLQFDVSGQTSTNGVTVFRSPAFGSATGLFAASCTGGTDPNCWPTVKVVAADNTCDFTGGHFNDKDYIAVDRSSSAASGSVYVVWTLFGCSDGSSAIQLVKCSNDLSTCTAPMVLESAGPGSSFVQLSHLTVGPTGKVYVTWGNHSFDPTTGAETQALIRLRVITPTASTSSVGTVGPLQTVHTETAPIPFGGAPYPALFRTATYPKVGVRGNRAIIVWDRTTGPGTLFNFFYLGSEIVAKFTDNDGASFSKIQTVSTGSGQHYQPTICVASPSGQVVVGYASHQNDPTWSHLQDWYVARSSTGAQPYVPLRVTPVSNDTSADPYLAGFFIGDYPEVACQGNLGYLHYTANYAKKPGNLYGFSGGIRQQDTFIARFTLP